MGDFVFFDLLQFLEVLSVFVQQPVVVLALGLVLVVQLVILLLQVFMLVLNTGKKNHCIWFVFAFSSLERCSGMNV